MKSITPILLTLFTTIHLIIAQDTAQATPSPENTPLTVTLVTDWTEGKIVVGSKSQNSYDITTLSGNTNVTIANEPYRSIGTFVFNDPNGHLPFTITREAWGRASHQASSNFVY
jgi:hypothetical protein